MKYKKVYNVLKRGITKAKYLSQLNSMFFIGKDTQDIYLICI